MEDWDWSEEGSVPHPFLAGGSASVTTSSLDHGYLNPAPPQIDSAPKPMSPGQRHDSHMTRMRLGLFDHMNRQPDDVKVQRERLEKSYEV